jgi:hypothetical protein
MAFYRTHNSETHVSESIFDIALGVYNTGGQLYFSSVMSDNFNVTIDQLEGEINVPYQYDEKIRPWTQADYDVAYNQWVESGYTTWYNGFPYYSFNEGETISLPPGQIPEPDGFMRPGPGIWWYNTDSSQPSEYGTDEYGDWPDTILSTIWESMMLIRRRIIVPDSILGGFGQWRINYTYIQYPENPMQEGTFIAGSLNTERLTVPKRIYNPDQIVDTTFTFNTNIIREAFADKIYQSFFTSSVLPADFGDIKSLQTTIGPGGVGYTTGRSEGEKLVFFKKDRNTPENFREFAEGTLSEVINDISQSLSSAQLTGPQDISEYLDDELSIIEDTPTTREASGATNAEGVSLYYFTTTSYKLQYHNTITGGNIQLVFAEYETYYVNDIGDDLYTDPITGTTGRWANVINLSQLTVPDQSGKRIDPSKARQILDTTIFELLPNQKTRQDEINEFFGDFNSLIGDSPMFADVDGDGAGEQIQDLQIEKRISTAPDNPNAFITRIDEEANQQNVDKTLESMRNRLNQYLGDVDNVVEEIQDERPEYENKSAGFLKIRKPNQAIILRDPEGEELDFQKDVTVGNKTGPSFLTEGFTITQWVRFVGKTGSGTLFSFGNPYREDIENRYGFRLETFTVNKDDHFPTYPTSSGASTYITPTMSFLGDYPDSIGSYPVDPPPFTYGDYERFVRLVVWDNTDNTSYTSGSDGESLLNDQGQYGKLYDSHFGTVRFPRQNMYDPTFERDGQQGWMGSRSIIMPPFFDPKIYDLVDGNGSLTSGAQRNGLPMAFNYTRIPTDDLDEWYFICATYDPTIDEIGSFGFVEEDNTLVYNKDFWLNHVAITLQPMFDVNPGDAITIGSGTTDYTAGISFVPSQFSYGDNIGRWVITLASTPGFKDDYDWSGPDLFNPPITDGSEVSFQIGPDAGEPFTGVATYVAPQTWFGLTTPSYILLPIGFDGDGTVGTINVSNSGLGARCKVEVISRSELLRARGYKVDKFDVPLEGE